MDLHAIFEKTPLVSAPPSVSDEDDSSLFKRHSQKEEEELSHEDQKTHDLIVNKSLLQWFAIISKKAAIEEVDLTKVLAFILLKKKEAIPSALRALGIEPTEQNIQDHSNLILRLFFYTMQEQQKKRGQKKLIKVKKEAKKSIRDRLFPK